jgi:hypothetical protein
MPATRWNEDDPQDHVETCPDCGGTFDMRDFAAVLDHVHDPAALQQIRSVIGETRLVAGTEVLDPKDE